MAEPDPALRLVVNAETGELIEQDDRDILIEQLQTDLKSKQLAMGKLKRELKELRSTEPEAGLIRDVLGYWKGRCMPRATIAPGGVRWEKVRQRLKQQLDDRPPWTADELKLAVDGALLDPWYNGTARGSKGFLDAKTIYKDAETVEKLLDVARGFEAQADARVGWLLDIADEIRMGGAWSSMLELCVCGHRRVEHSIYDPALEGKAGCIPLDCSCSDFDPDPLLNLTDRFDRRGRA